MNKIPGIAGFLGASLILGTFLYLALHYPNLPPEIPRHYNLQGEPDAWAHKGIIWILPVLSLFLFVGLMLLARYPQLFNYAVEIHDNNRTHQYRLAQSLVALIALITTLIFAYLSYGTIEVGRGNWVELNPWFTVLMIGLIFMVMIFYLILSKRSA